MIRESKSKRKYINFDLDTNALKRVFADYTSAYAKLKAAFIKRDFEHRQGSAYISKFGLSMAKVHRVLDDIVAENLWLRKAIKKIDVSDLPLIYDMTTQVITFKTEQELFAEQAARQNSPTPKGAERDGEELERD